MKDELKLEEIRKMIRSNSEVNFFVKSEVGKVHLKFRGQPIVIFKEDKGASYYFGFPCGMDCYYYRGIKTFMKNCVKCIGEMIEENRAAKLCYNPAKKQYLR